MDTDPNSWEANVQYLLERCPYTVWQRPGGGPVDLMATLVVTFTGMQMRLDGHPLYAQPDKARHNAICGRVNSLLTKKTLCVRGFHIDPATRKRQELIGLPVRGQQELWN